MNRKEKIDYLMQWYEILENNKPTRCVLNQLEDDELDGNIQYISFICETIGIVDGMHISEIRDRVSMFRFS